MTDQKYTVDASTYLGPRHWVFEDRVTFATEQAARDYCNECANRLKQTDGVKYFAVNVHMMGCMIAYRSTNEHRIYGTEWNVRGNAYS